MSAAARHRRASQRLRIGVLLHRWHRRIGLCAFVFLIWLAVSGIALNESTVLQLDSARIGWPWLMSWYGLRAEAPPTGFPVAGHWLVVIDDQTLLDGRPLQPVIRAPQGAAAVGGVLYVATADSLVLLKPDGTRIDELRALPIREIRRVGTVGDRIAIQDLDVYASSDGDAWNTVASADVRWSQLQPLPDAVRAQTVAQSRPSLPLARVVADAHSGRLFGRYGSVVVNAAGVAALLLAISGIWMVTRAAQRRRQGGDHFTGGNSAKRPPLL